MSQGSLSCHIGKIILKNNYELSTPSKAKRPYNHTLFVYFIPLWFVPQVPIRKPQFQLSVTNGITSLFRSLTNRLLSYPMTFNLCQTFHTFAILKRQ